MLRRRPGDAPGGLGELSGTSRAPPGTARAPPRATFWGSEATSETLWEDTSKMDAFLAVFASMLRRFGADFLLASVLVSVALESSRGKSNTLDFDDPYKGFATFLFAE